jgi:hypothetical protein
MSRRPAVRLVPAIGRLGLPVLTLTLACAPGLSPAPEPASLPAPVAAPRVETPRDLRFRLPLVMGSAGYTVRVRTELERDSAGRRERDVVESDARVELALRRDVRGFLRGSGRVDSFLVRGTGAATRTATPRPMTTTTVAAPLFTSVAIDAVLDSTQLRTVVRPPLANECDRPEAAAAGMARELLVRLPASVAVGDRWRDSLVTLVCRGGVPMTVRTVVESVLTGTGDGDRILRVHRILATTLEGSNRSPWRQVEISGEGRGTQEVQVNVERGTLVSLDGEGTLVVRIRNGSPREAPRLEQVTQKTSVTVRDIRH